MEYVACNLCGSDKSRVLIFGEPFSVVQCCQCGLVYKNPRPTEEKILNKFSSDGVKADHRKTAWYSSKLKLFSKNLERIEEILPLKGRLLDVGCGYGTFLEMARDHGWLTKGVELADSAVRYAREELKLDVFQGDLNNAQLAEGSFDAVTLWEVLGLFANPKKELEQVKKALKDGGVLAIRWHNGSFNILVNRILKISGNINKRFGICPTIFHMYNFSPRTITMMLENAGFSEVKVMVSESTEGDPYSTGGILGAQAVGFIKKAVFVLSRTLYFLTLGKVVLSPSFIVFARKPLQDNTDTAKIRVLHIITRLDKGGSAENTLITVLGLEKDKYDVVLASGPTNDPGKEVSGYICENKIKYVFIPDLVRRIDLIRDLKAFCQLYRLIKKNHFDIVHTHTSKAGILGRWAAWLARVRVIIHTPHGHIFYGYFGWFKTGLFICLEKFTAIITDRIITLTQRGKDEHIRYRIARPKKFVPIYSGIDTERFNKCQPDRTKEKEKLGIPADALVIGTVARLDPVKGNRYLIASLAEVVRKFPNLKILIIGEGSEKEILKEKVKELGLSKNVIFMGLCLNIPQLVSLFDLFILASLNEGMGKCLLEAQALGVPVVATDVGGIPEVVKDGFTGILVKPADPQMLAQAIIRLLKDTGLRQQFSSRAKEWVDGRFSAENMVRDIGKLYESVIDK